ncbi:recombinase family protein [Thermus antranikianii]|uniref:recombinase family protein n=1 Tax=Thermus antranikianii TaxID=88190 RepID=UPI001C73EB06|nr:recombinase family protein [Thermus antranikianii]QWK22790.1 MAG: recombinase family protein [Thermus antranikianii]
MKPSHWARKQGISYLTAWRWFKAGKLPVPARQLPSGTILVEEPNPEGRTVLYARVSSSDQKDDLQRQVQRLEAFAREQGWLEFQVVTEIASCLRKSVCPQDSFADSGKATGLNGKRRKLLRLLRDPGVSRIVVEHRDRLARFGFEMVEAALMAAGKRVVVVEEGEVKDDLVRDLLEILLLTQMCLPYGQSNLLTQMCLPYGQSNTSACGRLYGRRSARNRAKRALGHGRSPYLVVMGCG